MQDHEHLPRSYEALAEALARIKYLVLRTLTHEGRHHLYQLARASGELVDALSHEHGAAQARFATEQLEALMAEPRESLLRRYVSFRRPRKSSSGSGAIRVKSQNSSVASPQTRRHILLGLLGTVLLLAVVL